MNILIVGDSISSVASGEDNIYQCGFNDPKNKNWASLIQNQNKNTTTNLSIGGQSNTNILNYTCLELIKNKNLYDLVIIQWSSLLRINFNEGHTVYSNPKNFTVDRPISGYEKFYSIWIKNFLHPRVALLEWMTQIIVLANFLKQTQIPYMFIKGFDNFFTDLQHASWQQTSDEFKSTVLYLDTLPDQEVDLFYSELKSLFDIMENQTGSSWLNLRKLSWVDSIVDRADDHLHPGIVSHKNYFCDIITFTESLGLNV
jgi:hypothetical protein